MKLTYEIHDIVKLFELEEGFIRICIQNQWIIPVDEQNNLFDEEDLSRLLLIKDLRYSMDINEEAIPVIMHLVDQVYWLKQRLVSKPL